jgi:hypothetical protein
VQSFFDRLREDAAEQAAEAQADNRQAIGKLDGDVA